MKSKKSPSPQIGFLAPTLEEQLNPKQELVLLTKEINWEYFDEEFTSILTNDAHHIQFALWFLS